MHRSHRTETCLPDGSPYIFCRPRVYISVYMLYRNKTQCLQSLPLTLPLHLLPLVFLCLAALLALDLGNEPLLLLLVGSILLPLLAQLFARNEVGILAQLAHRTLALALVLLLQLGGVGTLLVRVVVLRGVEGLLELGNGLADGEGFVVVQSERSAAKAGL